MKKFLIAGVVYMSLILVGCSSNSRSTQSTTPSTSSGSTSSSSSTSNSSTTTTTKGDMTLKELSKYTGQNGQPAYVAVSGVIYDVTNAKEWQNGMHKNGVKAGVDLTKMIGESPHGTSVLSKLPIIGKLK